MPLPALLLAFAVAANPFPEPLDSEKNPGKPLPPAEAARGFQVPDGFQVSVFAAEPDVRNPIACCWDGRGRLWVAENYTYAERGLRFDARFRDRVLIFDDRDGDGTPEQRPVFTDAVSHLTSVEVGRGGVWLMAPPQLLFVPDRNADDVPDGPPEVVLEGFDVPAENHHNLANGLRWGPDGWLYGRCGASAPGKVRRPDQPPEAAVPLHGGVWRYHPLTKHFEPICHGTTNPWGHDWNEVGEAFFINTVNAHLWHVIPGAHYRRPHTISANPGVYDPVEGHADHWHFDTGKGWIDSRKVDGAHDKLGGGHAHSGAAIYHGSQWPAEYRGKLLTLNFHGRRMNVEGLERSGSGYVGRHAPDILQSADPFFRGIEVTVGPDGSVYLLDWSDTGECHDNTGVHRGSGRIFRVTYGRPKPKPPADFTTMTDDELVRHLGADEWSARAARHELADRKAAGKDVSAAVRLLSEAKNPTPQPPPRSGEGGQEAVVRLRRMLALYALGRTLAPPDVSDEYARVWAVRILTDHWPLDTPSGVVRSTGGAPELLRHFAEMAVTDSSAAVRLALASTLQRLPVAARPQLAAALLSHAEDAADHNIPKLVWYGLIPVARENPAALAKVAAEGKFPQVREWAARWLAERAGEQPAALNQLLATTPAAGRADVLRGLTAGLAGARKVAAPPAWAAFRKDFAGPDADAARALDVVFGDGRALDEVRRVALDGGADLNVRKAALRTLVDANPPDLRQVCEKLIGTRFLNPVALDGLAKFDDPAVAKRVAASYGQFHPSERAAVVEALSSRPSFAAELLAMMAAGKVSRAELTASQARRIRGFDRPELTAKLNEVWGELRDSPKEKAELIAKLKRELAPPALASADRSAGRAVFARACASCHKLFGAGGEVGPDLTGAGRKDLDYVLSNVADPSAVVTKDFQLTILTLADGRVVTGVVVGETPSALAVQTEKERLAVPKGDVEKRASSPLSLMPDGLLQTLSPKEVRDLVAYLMGDGQAELPK